MKKRLLLLSVLTLLLHATSWAYDFKVDGIYYNVLSSEDLTCEVTYLSTSNSNYSAYQGSVEIPNTVEYENATYTVMGISESAFSGCTALTDVTIPITVNTIGEYAFYQCSGLTEITIPNSVTSIGSYAFRYCSGLTEMTIPNSVTSIGSYAFGYCSKLTQVTIGESVTSIGEWAFDYCFTLKEVTIPESVTSIGSFAFNGCSGLTSVNFNATACKSAGSSSSKRVFYNCSHISTFNFGENVTIIPNYLCDYMTGLTEITIPNSVTSIGSYAFYNCTGLTEVAIGNGVTSIGNFAFSYCSGLTQVTIPARVTSIGNEAFSQCKGLTKVTIGEGMTEIGDYAFWGCSGLASIYSLNLEPPTCGSNVYNNVDVKTCILYVPEGSLGAYANISPWSSFYNIIEIEVDAIADILTNGNAEAVGYYTTDGKQVPTLQRGINIIRYQDGTAKKVFVK